MTPHVTEERRQAPRHSDSPLLFGIILILVGLATLVEQVGITDLDRGYWPFALLLAVGVVRLLDPPRSGQVARSFRPGMWFVLLGSWGLVNEFGVFGLGYRTSWPLLVVGAGLMVVWRSFEGPAACHRRQEH